MNGTVERQLKISNKINACIKSNSDKPYLKGFANYLGDNETTTVYSYLCNVIDFMDHCGNKELCDLSLDDYTEYKNMYKNMTSSYRIVKHASLKKFSEYLNATGINTKNPMQHIKWPQNKESELTIAKREKGYLTQEEIGEYIKAVESGVGNTLARELQAEWRERDRAIILLFLNTGLRCSALISLDVNSVDFDDGLLRIREKGGKIKEAELNSKMCDVLAEWMDKRELLLGEKEEDALFISSNLTRISKEAVSNIVKKYAKAIGRYDITPHKLRATYATTLIRETGNLALVQDVMGHSNPKTTTLYIRGQRKENSIRASQVMAGYTF